MKRITSLVSGLALAIGITMSAHSATLKLAYDADPVSLDPHEQLSGGTLQMSHMVFDPLVRWTQELSFEPRLAESWKRMDARTVRFNLRKDVTFHSGNPFTAKDVLWTFKRLKSSPDFKGIFGPFEAVNVIDDYTIDLVTKEPFPLVLHTATYIFPMDSKFYSGNDDNGEPKDKLVKHAGTYASTNASGTGPYVVSSREQGVKVEFALQTEVELGVNLKSAAWVGRQLVEALEQGQCDLIICYWAPGVDLFDGVDGDDYLYLTLGKEELVPVTAVGVQGEPMFQLPGVAKSPLPYISYNDQTVMHRVIQNHLNHSQQPPHLLVVNENGQATSVKAMITEGYGVGWLPARLLGSAGVSGLTPAGDDFWNIPLEIRVYRSKHNHRQQLEKLWVEIERNL